MKDDMFSKNKNNPNLSVRKKNPLFWFWSASRFETYFRILSLQSAICDHFDLIFSNKIVFKSADHSLGLVLAWLHCCPDLAGLQYASCLHFPIPWTWDDDL